MMKGSGKTETNLQSQEEILKSEIMVLRDLLQRAKWYTGKDIQSSPPTLEELRTFLAEVQEVRGGDGRDGVPQV